MTWSAEDVDAVRRAARGLGARAFAAQVARHLHREGDLAGTSKGAMLAALARVLPPGKVSEALRLVDVAQEWRRYDAEVALRKRDDHAPGVRDVVDSLARRVAVLEAQVGALRGRPG